MEVDDLSDYSQDNNNEIQHSDLLVKSPIADEVADEEKLVVDILHDKNYRFQPNF